MATTQTPVLFLSHSGQQKDFVWSLYRELLHVNHNPFFDQDSGCHSLPKGSPFPSRILEACHACKLGIVVLSHEYMESLWPMLELQQLLFHNPLSPHNVFPVFYKLKPADLSDKNNLMRWRSTWTEQEASWRAKLQDLQPTLDISLWPEAIQMLRCQNGQGMPNNKDGQAFIQAIVANICKRFPPPQSFLMGDHFKGAVHIQQDVHQLFQQQQQQGDQEIDDDRRMPISVGIHGVGGSGKTTMCKYMLNFYNNEYPGNCCFLQFPTKEEEESQVLVQSIKDIPLIRGNLAKESLDLIKSDDQAIFHLQQLLKEYKVFLILDNVWDWALPLAKQIVTMDFMPGSRLLVTARSEGLLHKLSMAVASMPIVHVPSISEEEAIEALMAYSLTSSWQYAGKAEDLRGLARSCFFGEQCHPLLLKAVGARLRHLGGQTHTSQDWMQLISRLSRLEAHEIHGDEEIETMVVNVLKTSYEALHSNKLKNTFLKLGACVSVKSRNFDIQYFEERSEWLRMISDYGSHTVEDIREQLMELEYHGLIQIQKDRVVIHDLQMMLIENIMRGNNGVPGCFYFQGDVATLSASEWRRLKYVDGFFRGGNGFRVFNVAFDVRRNCPHIEVVKIRKLQSTKHNPRQSLCHFGWFIMWHQINSLRLSVKHMQSLRHLVLENISNLKEVRGWHGAPNLVSVKLIDCDKLQKVESVAGLFRLESLVIKSNSIYGRPQQQDAEDVAKFLGHLPKLRELDLSGYCKNNWVNIVGSLSASYTSLQKCSLRFSRIRKFPSLNLMKLRVLDLSYCRSLESMEGSEGGLAALEELHLHECGKLESIPDLKQLVNLRRLKLAGCRALKEVKVGSDAAGAPLPSLEELSLDYGRCHFSTDLSTSSPLRISAFTNLRKLHAHNWYSSSPEIVDMGSSNLPVSLENLSLWGCETAQEIRGLSELVNLKWLTIGDWRSLTSITGLGALTKLESLNISGCETAQEIRGLSELVNLKILTITSCRSLTSITGLGALTKLESLWIWRCASLREVGHWEPPFIRYHLMFVDIQDCRQLETLSTMRHLPFVRIL